MLRFKPEVRFGYLQPAIVTVLQAAALWSLRARVDVEVNSANDGRGVHKAGSLHFYDLAVDLDTDGDRRVDLLSLTGELRRVLPPQYDVIFESDHIHVEWDTRRGPFPGEPPR